MKGYERHLTAPSPMALFKKIEEQYAEIVVQYQGARLQSAAIGTHPDGYQAQIGWLA